MLKIVEVGRISTGRTFPNMGRYEMSFQSTGSYIFHFLRGDQPSPFYYLCDDQFGTGEYD